MTDRIEMDYFPEKEVRPEILEKLKESQSHPENLISSEEMKRRLKILSAEELQTQRLAKYKHDCLCGQVMKCIILDKEYRVYACSPLGCGRIFLEDAAGHVPGTYYYAEQNEGTGGLD
jgi:hypothetical protein